MSSKIEENKNERGAVTILMAVAMVVLVGLAAFAIDIGSALVTKAELQNVSDAASLAATRELANQYSKLGNSGNVNWAKVEVSQVNDAVIKKAIAVAEANKAGGVAITIATGDVEFGKPDSSGNFQVVTEGAKAVRVTARRDEDNNGEVATTLARVIGINSLNLKATSAAGISAISKLKAGKGEIPVGISQYWFTSGNCEDDEDVRFYPTGDLEGCAGWHTFTDTPASASRLGKILDGLTDGSFQSPETTAGETYYNFTGGTVASQFKNMKDLYEAKRSGGGWRVTIPVYESADCSNPNGAIKIIGFARANITKVKESPEKEIWAEIECGIFDEDEIGGESGSNDEYGTLIAQPDVIQ